MEHEPQDEIHAKKIEAMKAVMKEEEELARQHNLVLVQISKQRYLVIKLTSPIPVSGIMLYRGTVIYGPASRMKCGDFLLEYKGSA